MAGATIQELPPEVLSLVFDGVDEKDLLNIRHVCKQFCEIANRPFAVTYITTRSHVISPESIDALVEISAHPFFGAFVENININAIRTVAVNFRPAARTSANSSTAERGYRFGSSEYSDFSLDNNFFRNGGYRKSMEQVFENLKQNNKSVTIGVYDSDDKDEDCSETFGLRKMLERKNTQYTFFMGTTLCETLIAVIATGSNIKGVEIDIQGLAANDPRDRVKDLECVIDDWLCLNAEPKSPLGQLLHATFEDPAMLRQKLTAMSFTLCIQKSRSISRDRYAGHSTREEEKISPSICYEYSDRSLEIFGFGNWPAFNHNYKDLSQKVSESSWLSRISVTEMRLTDIDFESNGSLDALLEPHIKTLKHVEFEDLSLEGTDSWNKTISLLSTAPMLELCRLCDLYAHLEDGDRSECLHAFPFVGEDVSGPNSIVVKSDDVSDNSIEEDIDEEDTIKTGDVSAILKDIAIILAADIAQWSTGSFDTMQLTQALEHYGDSYDYSEENFDDELESFQELMRTLHGARSLRALSHPFYGRS